MRHALAAASLVPLLAAGCSYYDASLLEPTGVAGQGGSGDAALDVIDAGDAAEAPDQEAGLDAYSDTDGPTPTDGGCVHAVPPDPPTVVDAGGDISFIVAGSRIDFGDLSGSDPLALGYDLDMRCTCPEVNGCMREPWATFEACDGPGGRDNMTGKFMTEITKLFSGLGSETWNDALVQGSWSLLLRVRDYNGLPNDDRVRLDWYIPAAYDSMQDGGADLPKWDGSDTWPIRKSSIQTPPDGGPWDIDETLYFDDRAYVVDGLLVASVGQAAIEVTKNYTLTIVGAFMTGQVVEQDGRWVITDGLIAGRWPAKSILSQVSRIRDPVFDLPICTNNPVYPQIKAQICSFVDIYSGVGTPTTPCDAVSAGMRFDTVPAQLGPLVEVGEMQEFCEPDVDPASDSCASL